MKKFLFLLGLFAAIQVSAQWPWEKVEGSGQVKKETRQVGSYTAVSSSGFWDVMIGYGESNSIEIEGDDNLLPLIETVVENGKLLIRTKNKYNLRSRNKVTVYVSLTRMTGVTVSGSGDVIGKGRFRNDGTTSFRVSGSGNLRIEFDRVSAAEIGVSGSGNIWLSGAAGSVQARVSGSGSADCRNLVADDVEAHISGSGNIKVNANVSIDASISGSGNITYTGGVRNVKTRVAGSGKVRKD